MIDESRLARLKAADAMNFTRLECRELLAHLDAGVDLDVLEKVKEGSEQKPLQAYPISTSSQQVPIDINGIRRFLAPGTVIGGASGLALTEKMQAQGWTQEEVDAVNRAARDALATQDKIRASYTPIVGEQNAAHPNAAFAPPEVIPSPAKERTQVGSANQYGDLCVRLNTAGESVYECQSGHGYLFSSVVRGCPRCFLTGGGTDESEAASDLVPGAELF